MIRLENVTYRYNENLPPALLNVSLKIDVGESICVMGANGSGKSTFAKLIAGLIKNQQGRFTLHAESNSLMPVGLLFQNPDNQMVAVTVEKEIAFALENLGISQSEMERKIGNVLGRLSITHLRIRLTTELSVGEKQRVALAAVLVSEPSILVLDEPDSYLDKDGKQLFRELLKILREHSPDLTVLEITQYPIVAYEYDRLIVFHQGRTVADGDSQTFLNEENLCCKYGISFDSATERQIVIPGIREEENETSSRVSNILLERVCFTYPGHDDPVIEHFSGKFCGGEIMTIVGPSGSGKSTLGMLLCGIIEPESGSIMFLNKSRNPVDIKKSNGVVTAALQQPERQFFLNTAHEEIEFGPKNFKKPISPKSIRDYFEMVGLPFEKFFSRDPFTLSLGEKRRLAFASVLSNSPDFIVFDEPTCALDQEGVGRFVLLAKALKESGIGVIIITHDDHIIRSLADKVIALDGKRNFWSMSKEKFLAGESHDSLLFHDKSSKLAQ